MCPLTENSGTQTATVPFAKAVQLVAINLLDCRYEASEPSEWKQDNLLSVDLNVDSTYDESQAALRAKLNAAIKGATKEEQKIFSLDVVFVAYYSVQTREKWGQDEINHFSRRNVVLHVWPYIREFVNSLTGRSPIPTVVLPLIPFDIPKKQTDSFAREGTQ